MSQGRHIHCTFTECRYHGSHYDLKNFCTAHSEGVNCLMAEKNKSPKKHDIKDLDK